MLISDSRNNTLDGNDVNGNNYGIILSRSGEFGRYSSNNILSNNNVNNNLEYGIQLRGESDNNIIFSNTVSNNNYGIYLIWDPNWGSPRENILYHNNLINNNYNAYDHVGAPYGANQWDNGAEGNHYSNYDEPSEGCTDSNSDGVCDLYSKWLRFLHF